MATLLTSVWQVITRKKTTDVPTDGSNHKKVLSVVDLTSLGLATTLGTGVYVILGQESRDHAGPSVVLSFLIASVASFLGGLCYAELGSRFPRAGSSYVYVYATMGELLAFLVGWTMMLELAIGGALAGKAWFQYIDALFNHATSRALEEKIGVIGILGLDRTLDIPAFLVALVAATAVSISVKAVCLFNNFLTIVGFLVIAGIVFVGLFNMDGENWTGGPGFFPNGLSGVLCASSTCCFSFIGYDIMATSAGEAQRHGRTLATAILCAFLVGLFACFTMSISTTLLIPFSLFADRAPLIRLFDLRGIVGMKYFVIVGAFAGLLSALVAALFALGRLVKGLAADGLLFASLARVSAKTGTPWKATMASGFLISLISLFFSVQTLVDLLGIGTILSTMIMALVILRLRYGLHERLLLEHKALSRETTGLSREDDSEISDCYYEINQTTATVVEPKRRPLPPSLSFSDARETTELLSTTSRPRLETIIEENGGATIERRNPRTPGRNPFMDRVPSPPGMSYTDYGSQTPRQMSVEYVNESFISSLMEFQEQPLPTTRTSRVTVVVFGLMVILMAVVALITTYRPELFLHAHYWPEVTTCMSIAAVLVLFVVLLLQPKHSPRVRNKVPCIPALPLGTVWLHVQLLASLPAIAWIRLAVWSFMGLVIYVLHGARHSRERIIEDDDHEVALSDIGDSGHLTLVNSHQQDDSISEDG